jgi:hypothetical protein
LFVIDLVIPQELKRHITIFIQKRRGYEYAILIKCLYYGPLRYPAKSECGNYYGSVNYNLIFSVRRPFS